MVAPKASVLALDIGGTKLSAGIGGAGGEITHQVTEPTRGADGAAAVLERALGLARRCRDEQLAAGGRIAAVGISTMGYTRDTHVELAPNVPGWSQLRIRDAVGDVFPGQPVAIGNDVKVAAHAEMKWGALRGVQHGVYLNLGTGIAAVIICDGRLLDGAHGTAGEIGYTLFRGRPESRMAADGAAPLEEFYGGAGAARRLVESGLGATVAELVQRGDEDPAARRFLDALWTGIAVAAANLCIASDPSVLVVGGGYVRGDSGLLGRLGEVIARAVPYPPEIVTARFGADASLRGAVALALAAAQQDRFDARVGEGEPTEPRTSAVHRQ